jgi:hypothetical protein
MFLGSPKYLLIFFGRNLPLYAIQVFIEKMSDQPTNPTAANKDVAAAESSTVQPFRDLRYPTEVGSEEYPHYLVINIYKQRNSSLASPPQGGNPTFNLKAGATRPTVVANIGGGVLAAGGIKLAEKFLNPLGIAIAAGAGLGIAKVGGAALAATKEASGSDGSGARQVSQQAGQIFNEAIKGLENLSFPLNRTTKERIGSIKLYTPNGIQVNDRHDFDAISATEALGLAGLTQESLTGQTATAVAEIIPTLLKNLGVIGERASTISVAGQGYAINPLLQVVYQQTKNREFQFKFKFAPRSAQEAAEVLSIIKTLRFHSYPEYSSGGGSRYFIPPSEFQITHYYKTKPNQNLPKIFQAVLSDVKVEYGPNATFATFSDGMPIEIDLNLTFTETIALTKSEISAGY